MNNHSEAMSQARGCKAGRCSVLASDVRLGRH